MSNPARYLLLAEDDEVVAELVIHTLVSHDPNLRIVHVRDGVETMDFLRARGAFAQRSPGIPTVVLLDIKMPRLDGLEVLRQMRADEHLRATPVVILTSSQQESDIRESYRHGASAYVVKPVEFRSFVRVLHQIAGFWMQINQPPPEHSSAVFTRDWNHG